jgi:hypothetical protein
MGAIAIHAGHAHAQSSEGQPRVASAHTAHEGGSHEPNLASEVIDPTASLLNVNLLYEWTIDHHAAEEAGLAEDDAHGVMLRPVIPFSAWGATHILRLSIPYELDTASGGAGLGASQIFDLVVIQQSWGRWGVGPVVNLVPEAAHAEDAEGADPFQVGPAIGVVASRGEWTLGALNQNLFSDDVQLSVLQPIVGYELSRSLSVSTGELEIIWDWNAGELEAVPLGAQLNVVVELLSQPLRFSVNPRFNVIDHPGLERWSVIFGATLLVPKE